MKKITKSDLGMNLTSLPDEQRIFMDKMADIMVDCVNKAIDGAISPEDVEAKMKSVNDRIAGYDSEKFAEIIKDNNNLIEQVKSLSEEITKLKQKGINIGTATSKIGEAIDAMMESEKFKAFVAGTSKDARGFEVKGISMTDSSEGNILITEQDQTPRTQIRDKKLHMRDIATVHPGDNSMLNIAWPIIYDMDRNARYVSENGMLPESSFKIREEYVPVKRLGHHFRVSRRAITSRAFLISFLMKKVVEGVLNAEDFGLMFGDGAGDMVKGITAYEGVKPIETIISEAIVSGAAGSVKGITEATNGLFVELQAPNDLIMEGMKVTFAGAVTNTEVNATFDVIKYTDTMLFLEGAKLAAANNATKLADDVAALTFVVNNGAFKSVESPNSVDALETGIAVMTYGEWTPSVIALNPITLNSIRTEKDTTGNRLKLVEGLNGITRIGGVRVIPSKDVPAGKYFMGDMKDGCTIVEFGGGMRIDWAEDVNTKLQNMVVLIAQEELIFPVYCPWAFAYGSISALKTAIAKNA